ncbi:hypothetical protein QAD02_013226 [Eretmocerus hayati]|uniref:Uncharacterized protein n=1 Tax=Eretmocerus hayati TaxID=131215 RepID=A0ACC2P1K9_9HYME|nr:hypothetical protein QAD02_013226 [Eretmocerus hayati]
MFEFGASTYQQVMSSINPTLKTTTTRPSSCPPRPPLLTSPKTDSPSGVNTIESSPSAGTLVESRLAIPGSNQTRKRSASSPPSLVLPRAESICVGIMDQSPFLDDLNVPEHAKLLGKYIQTTNATMQNTILEQLTQMYSRLTDKAGSTQANTRAISNLHSRIQSHALY